MGVQKVSKKQLATQVAQLEQELKLAKAKTLELQEKNEELVRKVAAADKIDNAEGSQLQKLEAENTKLREELDVYIKKNWRNFCAVQDSPTPYKKRSAFASRDFE